MAGRRNFHSTTSQLHDSIFVPFPTFSSLPQRTVFIAKLHSAMTAGKVLIDFKSEWLYHTYVMSFSSTNVPYL